MNKTYSLAKEFKRKYPTTVAWRINSHCKVIDKHLNPGEEVLYAFLGQKNRSSFDIVNTNVVVLTNKRILLAQKRVLWGYTYLSVTPDMFNDLTVHSGLIWGRVYIDTIKETIVLSNIDKGALDPIETQVTEYMMTEKKKYVETKNNNNVNFNKKEPKSRKNSIFLLTFLIFFSIILFGTFYIPHLVSSGKTYYL